MGWIFENESQLRKVWKPLFKPTVTVQGEMDRENPKKIKKKALMLLCIRESLYYYCTASFRFEYPALGTTEC